MRYDASADGVIKHQLRKGTLLCIKRNTGINFTVEEESDECNYVTFTKYLPAKFAKPCQSEFGTCLCILCTNMELKIQARQTRKLISQTNNSKDIISDSRNEDYTRENIFRQQIDALTNDNMKDIEVGFH